MHNLNDMIIFARVAEAQVISEAARLLAMPKSKVSRRMALLEEQLDVRLFERSPKGIRLTEAGSIFYRHCIRVVEEAKNAQESLAQLAEKPRGLLKISASISMGQQLLVPRLAEFLLRYPEIDLELMLENRRVDLIAEGYDLAIRIGELEDSNLVSKKLQQSNMKLFASPEYLALSEKRGAALNQISDLAQHKMLTMAIYPGISRISLCGPDGDVELEPKERVRINDLSSIRQLAIDGIGVALIPTYMVDEALNERQLVPVLPDWGTPSVSYYLLYPSRRSMTPKLRAMIDFITEIAF